MDDTDVVSSARVRGRTNVRDTSGSVYYTSVACNESPGHSCTAATAVIIYDDSSYLCEFEPLVFSSSPNVKTPLVARTPNDSLDAFWNKGVPFGTMIKHFDSSPVPKFKTFHSKMRFFVKIGHFLQLQCRKSFTLNRKHLTAISGSHFGWFQIPLYVCSKLS